MTKYNKTIIFILLFLSISFLSGCSDEYLIINNESGNSSAGDYLKLNQTIPQNVTGGKPVFIEGIISDDTGNYDFNAGTFLVPVSNGFHSTTMDDGRFNVISVNEYSSDVSGGQTMGGLGFINFVDGTNDDSYRGPMQLYGVFGFNSILNKAYVSGSAGGEFQSNVMSGSYVDTSVGVVSSVSTNGGGIVDNAIGVRTEVGVSGADSAVTSAYGEKINIYALNGGTIGEAIGVYVGDINTASSNYAIYTNLGDVRFGDDVVIAKDNDKLFFGAGKDSSIYYNGANLIINPKEVGSGYLDLKGVIRTTDEDYSLFGDTTGMNPTILPLTGRDRLYSAISSGATSGNIRAGFFAGNFNGTSSSALNVNGINAFANTLSSSTGDLTATNLGGGLRSRYAIRHDGKGTVALASTITANIQANGGNITKGSLYNAETPSVQVGKTIGDLAGFRVTGGTVAGTITTRYGLKVDSLLGGTTKWGVYVDADDSFFGGKVAFTQTDGNEYIDSLANGYMDYGATTQHRFNNDVDVDGDITADAVLAVHKAADGTSAVADGTYTMGIGGTQNGTITIKDGIIIAIQEAVE